MTQPWRLPLVLLLIAGCGEGSTSSTDVNTAEVTAPDAVEGDGGTEATPDVAPSPDSDTAGDTAETADVTTDVAETADVTTDVAETADVTTDVAETTDVTTDTAPPTEVVTPDAEGDGEGDTTDPVDPLAACEALLVGPVDWFDAADAGALSGALEFGQTHVVRAQEDRLAPPLTAERETLLLFTPEEALDEEADLRVTGLFQGEVFGVMRMSPPSAIPEALEQALTTAPIAPYSETAWSVTLPWDWMRQGVTLRLGLMTEGGLQTLDHTLYPLGSPHRFTLTRTHMVLFGEADFPIVPPQPATKVALDMAPWVPGAELRWVDTSPWRLDSLVVNTAEGPRWAHTEGERQSITTDDTRWNIIKHQGALRLSLANTGRGLRMTGPPEGDSSPYSYGTSMVQGWVRHDDGSYADVNNAGLAAGWTGWSGMWLNECGNGFIHEVGHTFTLLHFDAGTAAGWGIDDEYPLDGVQLASHPWGYDSVRQRFRTWYRVDSAGPVTEGGELVGKRDPMNGGEAPTAVSCYPPYTAYQMMRSQHWLEASPTLLQVDGVPGVYRWDSVLSQYVIEQPASNNQDPIAVGGPVVTVIGTLGNLDEVCQTYPPVFLPVGNAFALPDPADPELPEAYAGGQWFLTITYADGEEERALIAAGAIAPEDTGLRLYSVNLDATRAPESVALYRSATPYPGIDIAGAELIHTRTLTPSQDPEMPVLRVGHGQQANDELRLSHLCDPEVNCETRTAISTFPVADAIISFAPSDGASEAPVCSELDGVSTWTVPVVSETGESTEVVVHAQREASALPHTFRVRADDQTPWISAPNLRQSLRVWLPYEANAALPAGVYESPETYPIDVLTDGIVTQVLPLRVRLTVHAVETVAIPPAYTSAGLAIPEGDPASSVYYVFEDPDIGPAASKWWGDSAGNLVTVPVQDQETGEMATLSLRAHKIACGEWWEINTGQSANWGCTHAVHLDLEPGANKGLVSGHTYASPGSHPVVIKGVRWHEPNAGELLGVLALHLVHVAP